MSRVVASMKVFPEDVVISVDELKEGIKNALPDYATVYKMDEEPIAFGLVALIVHVVIPESSGKMDEIVETIKGVKGISEVETILVRRV